MQLSRQQERTELRKIGQFISTKILPGLPRDYKRLMGRVYGNAAYRQLHELEHTLYGGAPQGYPKYYTPHPAVVEWICMEWKRMQTKVELPPLPVEVTDGTEAETGQKQTGLPNPS